MENTIEKQITIKAPVAKVWKALTDAKQFSQWFGVDLRSEFIVGETAQGRNTSKGFEVEMVFHIKEMKPETYFSYAWIPFPVDKSIDYSKEERTLVEFFLEDQNGTTLLKVKESGFNQITASRRAEAFRMHTGGWEAQLKNIEGHVVKAL